MPDIYKALEAIARRAAKDARIAAPTASADDVIADMALLLPWEPDNYTMGPTRGIPGHRVWPTVCGPRITPRRPSGHCLMLRPPVRTMPIRRTSICVGRTAACTSANRTILSGLRRSCRRRGSWRRLPYEPRHVSGSAGCRGRQITHILARNIP